MGSSIFRWTPAEPAFSVTELTLLELVRKLARSGASGEVVTSDVRIAGRLRMAGPDHIEIQDRRGEAAIPLASVRELRLSLEGSVDDL
jgi:hypothetical protein